MKSTVSFLLLALTAPGVFAAEDIYRSVMPDGSVRYGEAPAPGAKSVKKVPSGPASTGVTVVTPAEKGRIPAPSGGGVTVIPQPVRPPTEPAAQGSVASPPGLPARPY